MTGDTPRHRPRRWGLLLGASHGLCFALAFAPVGWWALAPLSLAPLFLLARRADDARTAGLAAWLTAFPAWLFLQRWLIDVTPAGWPLLAAYLALYPGLVVWLGVRLRRTRLIGEGARWWLLMPLLWAGLESLRAEVVFHGYAWYLVGQTWPDALAPAGGAASSAVVLTLIASLVVSAIAGVFAGAWRGRGARWSVVPVSAAAALAALAVAPTIFPDRRPPGADTTLIVGVIQSNVPQSNKIAWTIEDRLRDFERMKDLTREAATKGAEVIVWPETMFPGLALNADAVEAERAAGLTYRGGVPSTVFHDALLDLQREVGVPMIVGAIAAEGVRFERAPAGGVEWRFDRKFNSVFVVQGGGVEPARYDKMHLTPFGETMPYISWNKWLEGRLLAIGAGGMKFDLSAAQRQAPLILRPTKGRLAGREVRVATPVCFEMTDARLVSGLAAGGEAQVILNVTNDGWFGPYAGGREEHLRAGVWRARELAVPVVRAANTGVSAVISSRGESLDALPPRTEGVLVSPVTIALPARRDFEYAFWISGVCMTILGVAAAYASIAGRRRPGPAPGGVDGHAGYSASEV